MEPTRNYQASKLLLLGGCVALAWWLFIVSIVPHIPSEKVKRVPEFLPLVDAGQRKRSFVNFLLPIAQQANRGIRADRLKLAELYRQWHSGKSLDRLQRYWVLRLAREYRIPEPDLEDNATWQELFFRVDEIPLSLTLAQAAVESAWGTSRFARDGNNLFGLWCYEAGCGLIPKRREKGKTHEVMQFQTIEQGIDRYLKNLNSNRAYRSFRELRAAKRQEGKPLKGIKLAKGLENYSEIGNRYSNIIKKVIENNRLYRYEYKRAQMAILPNTLDKRR